MLVRLKKKYWCIRPPPGGVFLFKYFFVFILFWGFCVFLSFLVFLVFCGVFDIIFGFLSFFSVGCTHFRRKILIQDEVLTIFLILGPIYPIQSPI